MPKGKPWDLVVTKLVLTAKVAASTLGYRTASRPREDCTEPLPTPAIL